MQPSLKRGPVGSKPALIMACCALAVLAWGSFHHSVPLQSALPSSVALKPTNECGQAIKHFKKSHALLMPPVLTHCSPAQQPAGPQRRSPLLHLSVARRCWLPLLHPLLAHCCLLLLHSLLPPPPMLPAASAAASAPARCLRSKHRCRCRAGSGHRRCRRAAAGWTCSARCA